MDQRVIVWNKLAAVHPLCQPQKAALTIAVRESKERISKPLTHARTSITREHPEPSKECHHHFVPFFILPAGAVHIFPQSTLS